jgi:predicted nucleic acid-binding protein
VSRFVLDCSVTMGWCFEDEADAYADAILDRLVEASALVPALWPMEVANVLLMAERRGRLPRGEAERFLELLAALPIRVEARPAAPDALVGLGRVHGLTAYDAVYLDLALVAGIGLASRDAALHRAAEAAGVPLIGAP